MKERECRGIPDETTVLAADGKRDHPSVCSGLAFSFSFSL